MVLGVRPAAIPGAAVLLRSGSWLEPVPGGDLVRLKKPNKFCVRGTAC